MKAAFATMKFTADIHKFQSYKYNKKDHRAESGNIFKL